MMFSLFLERLLPNYAVGEAVFSVDVAKPDNIIIPQGTGIKTKGTRPVNVVSVEDKILVAGETEVAVSVQCTEIGTVGNILPGELQELESTIAGIDSVTNELRFTGGVNVEDDTYYLQRVRDWFYILPKGTYDAFVFALRSTPSCKGWNLAPLWNKAGTTKVVVDPPLQIVIDRVTENINKVKAADEDITIVGVTLKEIDTSIILDISLDKNLPVTDEMKAQVKAKAEIYATTYIESGYNSDGTARDGMRIAQDFIPQKLNAYLFSQIPELENIENIAPTAPITIGVNERAHVGTLTFTVI
jgi:hypothetical protein